MLEKTFKFLKNSGAIHEGLYGISTNNLFHYYGIFGVFREVEEIGGNGSRNPQH